MVPGELSDGPDASGTAPTRCSSGCDTILRSLRQIRIGMMT